MNQTSDSSKRFLEATPEQRLEHFEAARVRDRNDLPPEVRAAFEKADQEIAEEWAGKIPEPVVIDMRTDTKAS